MSQRTTLLLPKNRLLRRTLYGLLLTAPALPLTGCGPSDDFTCYLRNDSYINSKEIPLGDDEPLPEKPSCDPCPYHARLLSCQATEVHHQPGVPRSFVLRCQSEYCDPNDGRRPEGLQQPGRPESDSVLGAFTAHVAWLEAASVPAFLRLADELSAHGAPEHLVKAARRSAGDEVRHTRIMQALAQRHGARMPEVNVAPFTPRSLEAMLVENAVEGCVRETFGALSAGWQARTAGEAQWRRAMRSIARDELRHSELAWAVDDWARERLTPAERERVLQARRETLHSLEREVGQKVPPEELVRQAGLPSREQALALLQGLRPLVARA